MNKKLLIVLTIFGIGLILDSVTTIYALNRGFIETREFSFQLKIFLLFFIPLLFLMKYKPEWIDLSIMTFLSVFAITFSFAGLYNLMVIIG